MTLRKLPQRYSVDELASYLAAPSPPMPLVELPPDARRDLAAWLLDTSP